MSVDVEALLTSFLRGRAEITALVADRVYSDLPHARTYPLILINRTGGEFLYKRHLEAAEVSIQCFGGTHKLAQQIAGTVLSTMEAGLVGRAPEGVVTGFTVSSTVYDPEVESADQSGHARPRFTMSCSVITHP